MARADLLINLVKYGASGDKRMFKKVVEAIVAEERRRNHNVLAERLNAAIHSIPDEPVSNGNTISVNRIDDLLIEISPQKRLGDLVLQESNTSLCNEIMQEQYRVDLLRSYSLEPRNRILLIGPPGNGKTSLAEAIAESLMVPLFLVRYEGVIGAYLGETASRLRRLFDYVRTRKCVLFLDEFETLGKERGDIHETGEIKRVVSSLLMQIDALPTNVIIIAATNHPELLDRAVWRRFQLRLNLPMPTRSNIEEWVERFQRKHDVSFGYAASTLAKKLYGSSFAEIEEFGVSTLRKYVLALPESDMKAIVSEELNNWHNRTEKVEPQ